MPDDVIALTDPRPSSPPREPSTRCPGAPVAAGAPAFGWRAAVRAALPGWLVTHGVVGAALLAAFLVQDGLPHLGAMRPASGLLAWDAGWYHALAEHGYGAQAPEAVRFFPLLPLLTRALATLTALDFGAVLLLLTSAFALLYAAGVYRLTGGETGREGTARRAATLAQIVPGAGTLVLGYTEALAGALSVAFFLLLRQRREPPVLALTTVGALAGLTRPVGLLLALPAATEFLSRLLSRHGRTVSWTGALPARRGPGYLLVVASAPLGTGAYLAWCGLTRGDALAPYTAQTARGLRGGIVVNPFDQLLGGPHAVPAGVVALAVIALPAALGLTGALLWTCGRRLPASYTVWAVSGVAAAITATGFRSLPRYLSALFPLLMAAALLVGARRVWYAIVAVCLVGFSALAYLSFTPSYTP